MTVMSCYREKLSRKGTRRTGSAGGGHEAYTNHLPPQGGT